MVEKHFVCAVLAIMAFSSAALCGSAHAQSPAQNVCSAHCIPESNTTYIDPQGTAHVTGVIPVPLTVSPQAQKFIGRPLPGDPGNRGLNVWEDQARAKEIFSKLYPVRMAEAKLNGVPVRIVTPLTEPQQNRDKVLINVHGGGFVGDGGSWTESIPIANLTQTEVVAVLYRLLPKYPFPAAVDDTVAVYRELLKKYQPKNIALYGTSAGATLAAETCVKIRQLELPLPGALGVFSGLGDFSTGMQGDTMSFFTLDGLAGHIKPPRGDDVYRGNADPKDPVLSPVYADLRGFPPTLFISSTRDMLLSGTAILHRAFLRADVDAQLIVFEGLSHAFWYDPYLPESKEAFEMMASFFASKLNLKLKQLQPYRWD